jgi:CheY-like chemotaxis protein
MKKHIILIEDDHDDLATFMDALKDLPGNFKCTHAGCPAKGLNMLQYLDADYIFVDYNLPGMNGIDVLTEIKNDPKFADTPKFLYSSMLNNRIREAAKIAGAKDCFQKPATIGEMKNLLERVLGPEEYPTFFMYSRETVSPEARVFAGNNFYTR